jgi:hypothetical protein
MKKQAKNSPIEKAITILSLGAVVAGLFLGHYGITGNVISEDAGRFMGAGMSLFLLGLFGVWIANKGK